MKDTPDHTRQVETTLRTEVVSTRVLTLPNILTFLRLAMIPVFLWLLIRGNDLEAALFFTVIASTDFVDGKLARHYNQISVLGKMLDPIADRVLLLAVALGVTIRGIVPWPIVALIAGREVTVAIVAIWFKVRGVQLEVRYIGKWTAALAMFAFGFFIGHTALSASLPWLATLLDVGAWGCGLVAICLGYTSVVLYVRDGRVVLAHSETGHLGDLA